jgi:hypothetical protein
VETACDWAKQDAKAAKVNKKAELRSLKEECNPGKGTVDPQGRLTLRRLARAFNIL